MRIAVPSDDGENIAEHFGRCESFVLFEVEQNAPGTPRLVPNPVPLAAHEHPPGECHQPHDHGQILAQLAGCDVVICRGMGRRMVADLARIGIRPVFTAETNVRRAVARFLAAELETLARPACRHERD